MPSSKSWACPPCRKPQGASSARITRRGTGPQSRYAPLPPESLDVRLSAFLNCNHQLVRAPRGHCRISSLGVSIGSRVPCCRVFTPPGASGLLRCSPGYPASVGRALLIPEGGLGLQVFHDEFTGLEEFAPTGSDDGFQVGHGRQVQVCARPKTLVCPRSPVSPCSLQKRQAAALC